MLITKAKNAADWNAASELLSDVVAHLQQISAPLWTQEQILPEVLASEYDPDSLHWLTKGRLRVGVVFLLTTDPLFWPECNEGDTLFFHKLAISPVFSNRDYGVDALTTIIEYARSEGYSWLRLDCDDRPALRQFYENGGFELVDFKVVQPYRVVRYQFEL
jgi:GNAT superfamily N-acetyltransferase